MELDKILHSIDNFFNTTPKNVIEEIEIKVSTLNIEDITVEEYLNSIRYFYAVDFDDKENPTSIFTCNQENMFENIAEKLLYNQASFRESVSEVSYAKVTTIEENCSSNTIKWFNV